MTEPHPFNVTDEFIYDKCRPQWSSLEELRSAQHYNQDFGQIPHDRINR